MFKKIKLFAAAMGVALSVASMPMSAFAATVETPLQDGGIYAIHVRLSYKVLDVWNGSTNNGAGVVQWNYWNSNRQKWRALQVGGYYRFVNINSGKVLEAPGGAGWGAQLQQWDWNGGANQMWQLWRVGPGDKQYYAMRNTATQLHADVSGFSYDNGAALIQWEALWDEQNQQFYFERVG